MTRRRTKQDPSKVYEAAFYRRMAMPDTPIDDSITLDEALEAFRHAPSPFSARELLAVANDYHGDEMIGAEELAAIKNEVAAWKAKQ